MFHGLVFHVMRHRPSLIQRTHVSRFSAMLRSLSWRELAYVGSASAVVPMLVAVSVAFWSSPYSPVALDRPAALVATGDVTQAAAAYDALAQSGASVETRREAAWRSAQLAALDASDPIDAVAQLERYLNEWSDGTRAADAWALMAGVYASELNDPLQAASCWEQAAHLNPAHGDAGRWLLESGKTFARHVQLVPAERVLMLATAYPDQSGSAWLALARMRLSEDPASAYAAYDSAARAIGPSSAGAALARLGMATALERLEGRQAALAQLDESLAEGEVMDRSLLRRRQRLRGDL
jgi:tetratricopeptide (TPR) repeat protein